MTWTFIWLILLIKIPVGGMLWLIWWLIKQADKDDPAPDGGSDDGGSRLPNKPQRHPRAPRPYTPLHPRRGPHTGARPSTPRRTRTVLARARRVEH